MKCGACEPQPRMKRSVQVQKPKDDATPDAAGHIDWDDDANWITINTYRCHIKTRGGSENWRFKQLEAEVKRIFQLRSSKNTRLINSRYRLRTRKDDGTWKLHGIATAFDVDDAREIVEIHATEVI